MLWGFRVGFRHSLSKCGMFRDSWVTVLGFRNRVFPDLSKGERSYHYGTTYYVDGCRATGRALPSNPSNKKETP